MLYRYTPLKAREAIEYFGCAEAAWRELKDENMARCMDRAERELDFIAAHGIAVYDYRDDAYPYRLRECADAPVVLYGKGKLDFNNGHMLSVVGTRRASEHGRELTHRIVRELAEKVPGLTIISGLAYGIDVAAHRAALEAGIPTIIIPAHGLDRIYPQIHRPVAVAAIEKGGILTEYPSGTEPDKINFVARNRIVAGMSDATLVVESAEKGGSLITAQIALDYGKDVLACPGRPDDPMSKGCNSLIRMNQAGLVTSADDIIAAMQWEEKQKEPVQTELLPLTMSLSPLAAQLVQLLRSSDEGLHVNQLVSMSRSPFSEVSSELMMLEIDGVVRSLPGGVYRAIK